MNKCVLITGASRGIGASIARKMASLGYNIGLNYLTSYESSISLKQELEDNYHIKVLLLKADVSKEEEVKEMVNKMLEEFNTIDILVNNAAIAKDNYLEDKTTLEFKNVLDVNLIGPFLTSKYVGSFFKEAKKGVIINIASTNALDTNEVFSMNYDASKAGLISLTHNFSKELAPFTRVNVIAPGWVNTEPVLEMNPSYLKEEEKKILLGRFGNPEEIANVVAFLASDEASYINNSIIRVDGGLK